LSYQRALKAINLEKNDRVPSLEVLDHPEFIARLIGYNPYLDPTQALIDAYRKLDMDMIISLPSRSSPLKIGETQVTDFGSRLEAGWGLTATGVQIQYPFESVEEILNFDPLKEGMEAANLWALEHSTLMDRGYWQSLLKDYTMVAGWYYNSLFMWSVMLFGWEMFMTAAALYPERFKLLIDKFALISIYHMGKWAITDVPVMICHDDLASSIGPTFNPQWYRQYIFPWYPKIWAPIKKTGRKVIFCSDGDITLLLDDLVKSGVDGFMIEPITDLKYLARTYGKEKIIIGGIDTRVLTFGTPEKVRGEVEKITDLMGECPGYFYMAAGSLPGNIPVENLEAYFAACKKYGCR